MKTNMADQGATLRIEDEDEQVTIHAKNDELSGRKSPFKLSTEDIDEISKKLLDGKFYLTALEFHTELIESGKEFSRLKEFFSNPGNFELQARFDPFSTIKKTASSLTLDSIDDIARYSDDGLHSTDEKITVLEYELRKAKETIHELRETITEMTSDRNKEKSEDIKIKNDYENQYEARTLNFLVNLYLLKHEFKFTSITFSEEIGDQDLDDWEDVGLNASQPPDLLVLLRDYSKHVVEPVTIKNEEIDGLQRTISKLSAQCQKLEEEFTREQNETKRLQEELETLAKQRLTSPLFRFKRFEEDNISTSSFTSNKSNDSYIGNEKLSTNDIVNVNKRATDIESGEINADKTTSNQIPSSDTPFNNDSIENDVPSSSINDTESLKHHNNNKDDVSSVTIEKDNLTSKGSETTNRTDVTTDDKEKHGSEEKDRTDSVIPYHVSVESWMPTSFVDLLFSTVHVKGESRLAHEVSLENTPVDVIAKSLPNIVPNVLLNKREELIPLILCAASFHGDIKTRDELLHMLFNLIKRPDEEQRKIIIDGCVTFAKNVGPTRIESELLPQCWEQINHKFAERRLLVSETCGFITPYLPMELSNSLIFSMLAQMLQEDRSEEVRASVVRSLALITSCMNDSSKYSKLYQLLEIGLRDIVETVVNDTKELFLPVFGLWASHTDKLISNAIPHFNSICKDALQAWNDANVASLENGESNVELLSSEVNFDNFIDCLTRLVPVMFYNCLLTAPFTEEELEDYKDTIEDNRLPEVSNPLYDIQKMTDDDARFCRLVNKFDDVCQKKMSSISSEEDTIWTNVELICNECITKACELSGQMFGNSHFIEQLVCFMCTVSRVFGKSFTQSRVVPLFEKMMRNTGLAFLNDVPPVASPLLTVFLCGVLSSFQGEEQAKRLFTFTKQCLVQIATQNLSMEYLTISITLLCQNDAHQIGLIETLRETIVYPVAEVRASIAVLFEALVKCVNQQWLSTHVTPAIITLTNDRDMLVRRAAIPALGTAMEVITDKSLLDKVCLQLQTVLDDPDCQKNIPLQKVIIKTFTKILPSVEYKFRDDFVLPRLKTITESNNQVEDLADRLEVAEELIVAFSSALCCFLPREILLNIILPALKTLEADLKDFSPETVDSVLLLQKEAKSKCEDDKISVSSATSLSTSSKMFSGISSRFSKFKKKAADE